MQTLFAFSRVLVFNQRNISGLSEMNVAFRFSCPAPVMRGVDCGTQICGLSFNNSLLLCSVDFAH